MKVHSLSAGQERDRQRVEAQVEWENVNRPKQVISAEVDASSAGGFWLDPNAFLIGCALPAWHAGEERIYIDGDLCPVLRSRIEALFQVYRYWYPELGEPPKVESRASRALAPAGRETLSLLSCGVDSLALLRQNRLHLFSGHPGWISAVLLVNFGKEYGLTAEETIHQALKRRTSARAVADDIRVEVLELRTNILELDPDGNFFTFKWHAGAFLFGAQLFSRRFSKVCIASSYDVMHLEPWGSHPLADPLYGTAHCVVDHSVLELTRFQKIGLLADWPTALDVMLVCQGQQSGETNCGACEKCIRTMAALVGLDRLREARAFQATDLSPDLLQTVREYRMIYNDSQASFYAELVAPLRKAGRDDLASVVESILEEHHRSRARTSHLPAEIAQAVPEARLVALADEQCYGTELAGSVRVRFWGTPSDGATAVREAEALHRAGVDCIAFTPATFWWLSYFPGLAAHLQERYRLACSSELLIAFDLTSFPDQHRLP